MGDYFFRHKSVTPTSLSRQKVLKIVGATGFEPATSWSQKVLTLPSTAKIGHFAQILVHQVHRVTQFHYSLVTVRTHGIRIITYSEMYGTKMAEV